LCLSFTRAVTHTEFVSKSDKVFRREHGPKSRAHRGDACPRNLKWGMLMQIVPRFSKIPARIHQNTQFQAKSSFFWGGLARRDPSGKRTFRLKSSFFWGGLSPSPSQAPPPADPTPRPKPILLYPPLRSPEFQQDLRLWMCYVFGLQLFKAKFHYASWFGAGSKLVRAEIWPII